MGEAAFAHVSTGDEAQDNHVKEMFARVAEELEESGALKPVETRELKHDPVFTAAFRYFLAERGWTQKEFADRSATPGGPQVISKGTASVWKNGDGFPSVKKQLLTAEIFGVSREFFLRMGSMILEVAHERERLKAKHLIENELDLDTIFKALSKMSERQLERAAEKAFDFFVDRLSIERIAPILSACQAKLRRRVELLNDELAS